MSNENKKFPSFHYVPDEPLLSVNKYGTVIHSTTGEALFPSTSSQYVSVSHKGKNLHVHVLVAKTFLARPESSKDLEVNHIDGNKHNPQLVNLEWVTRSGNIIHAYKTGLRKDNTRVLVRDLRDGSIQSFYSLQECARHFGVNGALIWCYLKSNGKIQRDYYVFIREGQNWPNLTKEDIGTHYAGRRRLLLGFHEETGKSYIFDGVTKAAAFIRVPVGNLSTHISRYGEKPYMGISFKTIKDTELKSELTNQRQKSNWKPPVRKPKPVEITNLLTGESKIWDSTEEFANSQGSRKNSIQACASRNNGKWKNFSFKYL